MSDDNRTLALLHKADLTVGDLKGEAGFLNPGQAARFIRIAIDESVVMSRARTRPMKAPAELLEKTRFGSRIMRAGAEGTPVAEADRARPDLDKVELLAKLFRAEVDLSDEVLDDNIERKNLKNTIMTLMGERGALDMDEVLVNGDTSSLDPFLAQFDGIRKQATSNIVLAGGETMNKGIFREMIKKMPTEFRKRKKDLTYFTSFDGELDYSDTLADRMTPLGDRQVEADLESIYKGIPVVSVPVIPDDLGGGNDETEVILTNTQNIVVGMYRRIRMRTDLLVREGILVIVADVRFDVKYEEETAVVKATGIEIAA